MGLCAVCGGVQSPQSKVQSVVWRVSDLLCLWANDQADAGDSAVRAAVIGLLAAEAVLTGDLAPDPQESAYPGTGEGTVFRADDPSQRRGIRGAKSD